MNEIFWILIVIIAALGVYSLSQGNGFWAPFEQQSNYASGCSCR